MAKRPDLIVIDPAGGIDGWELILEIRNMLEENSASIIVLTEEANFTTRLHSYEVGANDFLAKPFQPGRVSGQGSAQPECQNSFTAS